ncbi:MAG: carbohydrate kinase family protein [Thermoguttaceae bacterium]
MNSESKNIVAIGEVLWDLLPRGAQVGGAPGNLAFHAKQLGANAAMISRVGDDERGRNLIAFYESKGMATDLIDVDKKHPTGVVQVALHDGQATYTIVENVAWDYIVASDAAIERVASADAFCYGSLAWRSSVSRDTIRSLLKKLPTQAVKFCDINLRPPFYDEDTISELLTSANIVKLNRDELNILAKMFRHGVDSVVAQSRFLMQRFDVPTVIVTCGADGSVVVHYDDFDKFSGRKIYKLVDTVGAGDAFSAAFLAKHLAGWRLEAAHRFASRYAAAVCQHRGATPVFDQDDIAHWERESRDV